MPDPVYALQLSTLVRSQMRKVLFVGVVGDRVFEYVLGAESWPKAQPAVYLQGEKVFRVIICWRKT